MLLESHPADDTRALIIDFDHGEIKDKSDNGNMREDEHKDNEKRLSVVCPCTCL